jgi:hypothetical protein
MLVIARCVVHVARRVLPQAACCCMPACCRHKAIADYLRSAGFSQTCQSFLTEAGCTLSDARCMLLLPVSTLRRRGRARWHDRLAAREEVDIGRAPTEEGLRLTSAHAHAHDPSVEAHKHTHTRTHTHTHAQECKAHPRTPALTITQAQNMRAQSRTHAESNNTHATYPNVLAHNTHARKRAPTHTRARTHTRTRARTQQTHTHTHTRARARAHTSTFGNGSLRVAYRCNTTQRSATC